MFLLGASFMVCYGSFLHGPICVRDLCSTWYAASPLREGLQRSYDSALSKEEFSSIVDKSNIARY